MALQHIRSSTLDKRPQPASLSDGQLAINTNLNAPGVFFKDSNGALVKVGPTFVGTTAPNSTPGSGGATGNTLGEQWLDTSGGTYVLKIWDGTAWRSEAGEFVNVTGDTMTGALVMDNQQQVRFRETTANGTNYIALQAPASVASDKTITLPDVTGTVVTTGDTGSVTSTMILDGTILNADVNASAAIAGTKISPDFGSQNVTTTGTVTGASLNPTSSTVPTNGVYLPAANSVGISTNSTGRLFIDSSGNVGVGVTPNAIFEVAGSESVFGTNQHVTQYLTSTKAYNATPGAGVALRYKFNSSNSYTYGAGISFEKDNTTDGDFGSYLSLQTRPNGGNATERLRITSGGLVGIGTTTPTDTNFYGGAILDARGSTTGNSSCAYFGNSDSTVRGYYGAGGVSGGQAFLGTATNHPVVLYQSNGEALRVDTSKRLLVGTSSASTSGTPKLFQVVDSGGAAIGLGRTSATSISNNLFLGGVEFLGAGLVPSAAIYSYADADQSSTSDLPSRLVFSTTADGESSPTERMRIKNNGEVSIGEFANGYVRIKTPQGAPLGVNRTISDGTVVEISQDGTVEGTISVSGTTVSYNGAHLSRWSQIPGIDPHDKTVRPEILRGTVMSNLDEMCDWIDPESGEAQANEQLNKTKVNDVEGDKNVAGIFQSWDDDDDIWVNDYYLAMTGDFIIRIGAGVTVERGDLLMSAGDGTAKPQDDDIIRSKTIAKVTSTNVSCTYDDGSYCVPCVLMAC